MRFVLSSIFAWFMMATGALAVSATEAFATLGDTANKALTRDGFDRQYVFQTLRLLLRRRLCFFRLLRFDLFRRQLLRQAQLPPPLLPIILCTNALLSSHAIRSSVQTQRMQAALRDSSLGERATCLAQVYPQHLC